MQNNNSLEKIRHSTEHILTQAMIRLYPDHYIIPVMGPATEEGFYFDFDSPEGFKISNEDFPKIEAEMKKIIKEDLPIIREEISWEEAKKLFSENPYKLDWLEQIKERGEKVIVYRTGEEFVDLCAGPHIESTGKVGAFKLLSVAGAYFHGDEKREMLTRIYGTAFPTQKELDDYLLKMEEAKKRDHRKLGQELELFVVDEEVGQGLILWAPKGAMLRKIVMDFAMDTYLESGYEPVCTPHIASNKLWSHSGHVDFYKESLYGEFGIDEEQYRLKPMNCPLQVAIYKSRPHSYRELPLRWTEMGTVYRYERSGVLHGLTRVRGFTQDDAHIICTPEQLHSELKAAFELTLYILKSFGFDNFEANLSIRDPENKDKFAGSDKDWQVAEKELRSILEEFGYGGKYVEDVGGAVFYGPKIDIKVSDAIGRKWQLSTLQFDFNLPGRFDMTYTGADGKEHTPYMIHRALLGSLERFIGVLIEHYGGAFPAWLAPVQVVIIPISQNYNEYAGKVADALKQKSVNLRLRVLVDDKDATMQSKIRDAQMQKIPYMLIVGEKEVTDSTVSVRSRDSKAQKVMKVEEFKEKLQEEILQRLEF